MKDDIRPPGTVQVSCQQPGCNWAWWVGALDPRLPDGPWDCGNDHDASNVLDHFLGLIRVRFGLVWGSYTGNEPSTDPQRPSIGNVRTGGIVKVTDRWGRTGSYKWPCLDGLRDVDAVLGEFKWEDDSEYPSSGPSMAGPDYQTATEVFLRPWKTSKGDICWKVRADCARCGNYLFFDYYGGPEATKKWRSVGLSTFDVPDGKTVDFVPEWLKGPLYCEDAISNSYTHQPCAVKRGPVLREMEETTSVRWTVFDSGLLMVRDGERYGMLYFGEDLRPFESVETLLKAISWAPLKELSEMLDAIPNKVHFVPTTCVRTAAGVPSGVVSSCTIPKRLAAS